MFMKKKKIDLTLFTMGGWGPKRSHASFYLVTYTNVGINPQIYLSFSFNHFSTLVSISKAISSASSNLLNLNQDLPQKMWSFWPNPYKTEVMITSLIDVLVLPNFGHATIYTT